MWTPSAPNTANHRGKLTSLCFLSTDHSKNSIYRSQSKCFGFYPMGFITLIKTKIKKNGNKNKTPQNTNKCTLCYNLKT